MHRIVERPSTGDTVRLAVGDTVEIQLPQRGSTGYQWSVATSPNILTATEPDASSRQSVDRSLPGASTVSAHYFTAVTPGTGDLRIDLRRPWETGPPTDSITIAMTVVGAAPDK